MKRRLAIFLIGILCMTLFAACGNEGTPSEPVDTEVSVDSETSVKPSTPAPEMKDTVLANMTAWKDNDSLYEVPVELPGNASGAQVHRYGHDFLVSYDTYDQELNKSVHVVQLISIETGEVLHERKMDSLMYGEVQILDNYIAINDQGDSRCYLLDDKLQIVEIYDLPGGKFCLNSAGDTAYQFTYNNGIIAVDLETKTVTNILENAMNVYMCKADGEKASFVYVDLNSLKRHSGVMSLATGEIQTTESPYVYSNFETGAGTWLGKMEGEEPIYVLSDGTKQRLFYSNLSANTGLNSASGHLIIGEMLEDGATTLLAYDNQGVLLSSCQATDLMQTTIVDFAWYEEYKGYVFILVDNDGQNHMLFWNVSATDQEDSLVLEDVEERIKAPAGSAVSQELFERAEELSQKYDVEILIADQCDIEFTDHRAELLLDEAEVEQALNTLDYVMGRYPSGFFSQLKHDTYSEIEIQILGVLEKDYSTDEQTFISGGFVTTAYPGKLLMALDARPIDVTEETNPILAQTMYHEISHMIDKRLAFNSLYMEDAVYTDMGWTEMNPEEFEYNDSYYGTLDPKYADYFVDAYACTNGTEDRARTMEYAMAGEIGTFAGKKGLTDKLEYYSKGIRDSFDTTGWPDELPWEKTLNEVR